jgi:cytochrome b561
MSSKIVQYSKRMMWLHWLTLLLGTGQMITGKMLTNAGTSDKKFTLYIFHFGFGIAVLIFTFVRAYFFFKDPRPEKPKQLSAVHKKFMNTIHIGFYIVLLSLGLTGLISVSIDELYSPLITNNPRASENISRGPVLISHFALSKIFILLFILHIFGFLRHWIKFKENRLKTISAIKESKFNLKT